MRITLPTTLIVACVSVASVHAASPADAIKEFGMLGTWAVHCDEPVGKANLFVTYAIQNGQPIRISRTPFKESTGTAVILTARVLDQDRLEYSWILGETYSQIIIKKDNRFRLLFSKAADGRVFYDDGHSPADGSKSIWFEKCRE